MFWSATCMIGRFWLITGDNMLGLEPMTERIGPRRFNPYVKAVPVTSIMDTQLDEITIKHVLKPLKEKLLDLLDKTVFEKKGENWYETCLATFIILHNSEVIISQVVDDSSRYGISVSFCPRPCVIRFAHTGPCSKFAPRSNDGDSLSDASHSTTVAGLYFITSTLLPAALLRFLSPRARPTLLRQSCPKLRLTLWPISMARFRARVSTGPIMAERKAYGEH